MAIGGEQFICGQYTATWNSLAMGIFQGDNDVPAIISIPKGKAINNTDKYGYAMIDGVHMGYDYRFEGILMEYPKAIAILNPFGVFGVQGTPGMLKYFFGKPLVLTVVNNGTTAVGNPNTLTAPKAMIAQDFDARIFYGPNLRVVPMKMDLYPSVLVAGQIANFTQA